MIGLVAAMVALVEPGNPPIPSERPGLSWLHGDWVGTATIFAQAAQVKISAGPALRGTATTLSYHAIIPATTGQPAFEFEGRGTYKVNDDSRVIGNWSDSQGNFHPLAGRVTAASLVIVWGEPRTEIGRSVYTLQSDGGLVVTDSEIGPDGTIRVFSSQTYSRRR